MFKVNGTNISLTRGDSATLHVDLTQGGAQYEPQAGDVLTLTVKDDPSQEEAVLTLTADGNLTFHFLPSDTAEWSYGNYKYDIQLTTAAGDVYTVIPVSTLSITDEVTWGTPTPPMTGNTVGLVNGTTLARTWAQINALHEDGAVMLLGDLWGDDSFGVLTAIDGDPEYSVVFLVSVAEQYAEAQPVTFIAASADDYPIAE